MRNTIYIAGPISGQEYDAVIKRFADTRDSLVANGFSVLSPLESVEPRTEISGREHDDQYGPALKNRAIVQRDKWYVLNSDIIFADMRGTTRVSIGTCFEIAWAAMHHKYIIAVMEEGNVHRHAFFLENVSVVFTNYDDAMKHLMEVS